LEVQENKCFYLIRAEAATLREYGCNLYDASQDGAVSIAKYISI